MQCKKCSNVIIEGEMYCRLCNESACMVPEYNLQDEILIHQVTMALEGRESTQESARINNRELQNDSRKKEIEARRLKSEQNRRKRALKCRIRYGMLLVLLACTVLSGFWIYSNSYTGLVKSGTKSVTNKDYDEAIKFFERAISKKNDGIVAYEALAKIYIAKDEHELAENLLIEGVENNISELIFYELIIDFYLTREEYSKVMPFLNENNNPDIIEELADYLVYPPTFSLEEGVFDDVREVSLSAEDGKIFYAIENDSDELDYEEYINPVQISDGEIVVVAIVENELGITSVPLSKKYQVELPVEGAPIVTPSTGQYTAEIDISVQVPAGYTAYYTMDGSTPDESSKVYEKSFAMPEGSTVLSVVLINGSGKKSDVTKRNYKLIID